MTLETKYCHTCKTTKPVSDFTKRGDRKGGLVSKCRACKSAIDRERKRRNREKHGKGFNPYADPSLKSCYDCGLDKPRSEFYKLATNADGLQAKCKSCSKTYDAGRSNQPSVGTKQCATCSQVKTSDMFYNCRRNADGLHSSCIDCTALKAQVYREENPHIGVRKTQRRRTKQRGQYIEDIDPLVLRDLDGDKCCYCGIQLTFTKRKRTEYIPTNAEHEHLVAIDNGGLNSYENSTLICAKCNRSKQSKTVLEFIAYREARGLPIQLNAHVAKVVHESTYYKEATCTSSTGA